ncbi:SP_0009 family protein [Streptococcus sp. E17BB]
MDDLIKTIEKFLAYSDDKLEELAEKNQALREQTDA